MELNELYLLIKKTLTEDGFKKRTSCCDESLQSSWLTEAGTELTATVELGPDYAYNTICGYTISVEKVHHRNGAAADTSYYLDAMHWDHSSGRSEYGIKISSKQTEKTLIKKIKDFEKNYLQIIKNVI